MSKYKSIGILGGMGPEATAELYLRIVRIFQQKYGAKYDDDFPEMIIVNLPLPDVVENSLARNEVRKMLINGARKLERAEVDFIVIPCNTVTYYLDDLQQAVSIPFLNILEETAKEIKQQNLSVIGILGTQMTICSGIYGDVLEDTILINPETNDLKKITQIIMNILSGKKKREDKDFLLDVVKKLKLGGAEKIILGCTELPLLLQGDQFFDTIEILATATVRNAIQRSKDI